jgi:IMP dehydrogenase/GMP reductase
MVFEKIYDPDEKRKEEALKEALRKEEEQKMQEQKDRLEQINNMRGKIEELRNKINSTKVSDDPKQDNDLKQEPLKKLDEAEGYLKSAEEQIKSNNIKDGIGYIDNAQRSVDAASHWLSRYQNKEQSLGMGI